MLPVLTADQMREVDKATIEELGIPGAVLMENAGRAVVECVLALLAEREDGRGSVLCGAGNNGGDGYVVARVLQEQGVDTLLYAAADPSSLQGDASLHAQVFQKCGGEATPLWNEAHIEQTRAELADSAIIVDALFGTGLDREIQGHYQTIIEIVNASAASVVAVDLPSGLRCDDGRVMRAAIQADATVTFACAKIALVSAPGFASCGVVHIAEMGIPHKLAAKSAMVGLLEAEDIDLVMHEDEANTHKGSRGHVLAIAGSEGKRGAGRLAAMAALRAGSGLVTLAAAAPDSAAEDPLMTASLGEDLSELLEGKSAVLVGPGMDPSAEGRELVLSLLASCALPMVLDADALNHLGGDLSAVAAAKGPVILTPHPGEAGRLLGIPTAEVQADRLAAVRRLAAQSKAVVVLKGARSCICDGRHSPSYVQINPTGGPELSTAGTGDVLAGMLAALLARGLSACQAAVAGAYWHGVAGSLATQELGGPGLVASDLLDALPPSRVQLAAPRIVG